ncbi:putative HTH CENPB-type domain-containing protein [Phytophthora infestans]|uniref:Putative HTH CENPB-type domain-containing protein n=1 Tax=Phytophthora infestans TaxID=4787 RepID=A0A833T4S0_PHYIN|nr:putative HTH CENPB-type domain-containing protein [Phytophthora infestans]
MAKQLAQSELRDTRFLGSSKWVDGLMHRYDLSLRRTTNLTELADDVLTDRAVCYMEYLFERKDRFNLAHTVLMDETAVYFEDPRRQTIDSTGARHVVLKSTGVASMRVTAVLAVVVSGQKLPRSLERRSAGWPT